MQRLKEFFSSRAAGFYVSLVAAVFSVVVAIVYAVGYNGTVYMSWTAFALPLVAAALFAVLCLFRQTEALAPLAMGLADFLAFLTYIYAVYLYLSEVFYAGVSPEAIANLSPAFVICTILMLLNVVLSNIGIYMKQSKPASAGAVKA